MIKITLIVLGKLKEKHLRETCEEYQKRLSRYCDLKIIELSPVNLSENPNETQIEGALLKEKDLIIKKIPESAFVYSLCVEGKQRTSEEFAGQLEDFVNQGKEICFIIGSSHGLHEEIKSLSKDRLSLSKMTFPHQLFRGMLLEQIYRAEAIQSGSKYHK